jgi:hypothetical protein
MSLRSVFLLFTVILILNSLASKSYGTTYSGSLNYDPQQPSGNAASDFLVNGDKWPSYKITLSWTVTNEDATQPGFPWKYTYTFGHNGGKAAISHLILETSNTFTLANLTGLTGAKLDSIGMQSVSSGNPGMPSDMYGIRLDPSTDNSLSMTWTFWSNRMPVWGDFYVKNGKENNACNQNTTNNVQNGFTSSDTDPTGPAANGSLNFHILRPDTTTVPEPTTMGLILLGSWLVIKRRQA